MNKLHILSFHKLQLMKNELGIGPFGIYKGSIGNLYVRRFCKNGTVLWTKQIT